MSKVRVDKLKCSVLGCVKQHNSLHRPPTSEQLRSAWLRFIFRGNVPPTVGKVQFVCAKHFKEECFSNLRQYNEGFAQRLHLIEGSVPTVYGDDGYSGASSSAGRRVPLFADSGCQTDAKEMRSVGTQLSIKTLKPHVKSTGTQANPDCTDVGVCTSTTAFVQTHSFMSSTPVKRPHLPDIEEVTPIKKSKRIYLEQFEEGGDSLEGSSSMNIPTLQDSTYDPEDSISALTEADTETMVSAAPIHQTPTYIVYEKCLLELFEVCPVCQRVSEVRTRRIGTFLCVEQRCLHCNFLRKWNSQPLLGSTPAGNLQLSTAVYTSGGSFFQNSKDFPCNEAENVPTQHLQTTCQNVHRACNNTQVEVKSR